MVNHTLGMLTKTSNRKIEEILSKQLKCYEYLLKAVEGERESDIFRAFNMGRAYVYEDIIDFLTSVIEPRGF